MEDILRSSLSKTDIYSTKEVEQILKKKLPQKLEAIDFGRVWDASAFQLDKNKDFLNTSSETQDSILKRLAVSRFQEAYDIENAGMSFAAKMSLLAESIHEQKMYSLFAAEEATHFNFIQLALADEKLNHEEPFIKFLNEVIATGARKPLIFIIQVVLEGWGIDHYQIMQSTCKNTELKEHLKLILIDEASHHGSGVSLFDESSLSTQDFNYIVDMMAAFLGMVNIGPVGMITCMKELIPNLNEDALLDDINAFNDTTRKLEYLKSMVTKSGAHKILAKLEEAKLFDLRF